MPPAASQYQYRSNSCASRRCLTLRPVVYHCMALAPPQLSNMPQSTAFCCSCRTLDTVTGWMAGHKVNRAMRRAFRRSAGLQMALLLTVVSATAMVVGDGILTPSISVMGAVDGLTVATDNITPGKCAVEPCCGASQNGHGWLGLWVAGGIRFWGCYVLPPERSACIQFEPAVIVQSVPSVRSQAAI
eukprot:GHUV01020048.1.p1 GENE.GHUV01020048.1~~GHUV01020048.1.p1  ORF type:complete len:187 (-),score=29.88 GHUV01020048.1:976-1536(-)